MGGVGLEIACWPVCRSRRWRPTGRLFWASADRGRKLACPFMAARSAKFEITHVERRGRLPAHSTLGWARQ
jgi:hypothetical protein